MKRLLLALALLCTCASAQGALLSIPTVMTTSQIGSVTVTVPAANVSVQVCTSNGAGIPCTPVASLYQNQALTTPASNPGITNAQGVPLFSGFPTVYVQPGIYIISETGSAITGGNVTLQAACSGSGACILSSATLSGTTTNAGTISGGVLTGITSLTATSPAITPTSIEGVEYVDQFAGADPCAKLTAAYNAAPASGGQMLSLVGFGGGTVTCTSAPPVIAKPGIVLLFGPQTWVLPASLTLNADGDALRGATVTSGASNAGTVLELSGTASGAVVVVGNGASYITEPAVSKHAGRNRY